METRIDIYRIERDNGLPPRHQAMIVYNGLEYVGSVVSGSPQLALEEAWKVLQEEATLQVVAWPQQRKIGD